MTLSFITLSAPAPQVGTGAVAAGGFGAIVFGILTTVWYVRQWKNAKRRETRAPYLQGMWTGVTLGMTGGVIGSLVLALTSVAAVGGDLAMQTGAGAQVGGATAGRTGQATAAIALIGLVVLVWNVSGWSAGAKDGKVPYFMGITSGASFGLGGGLLLVLTGAVGMVSNSLGGIILNLVGAR
ncbi:hypothetical protein [Streptomyces sp. cg36]|uniref:hypothetical protein n=1 Tax=Streptomyces sp. cg36 TaxID=3238798 RepID=UPI0034E1FD9B